MNLALNFKIMFLKLSHLSLQFGEKAVKVVRQSKTRIFFPLFFAFLIYLAAFFLLFYFLSRGKWGLVAFFSLLGLATFYAVYKFYFWYSNAAILTTKRIVDIYQKKFFERIVSDVPYHRIKDVVVKVKGPFQMLTRSGVVLLILEGHDDNLELNYISRPEKIRDLILVLKNDEQNDAENELKNLKKERVRQIYEEIKDLDNDTLEKILARLPAIIKEESESLFFDKR